jgi:N-acetylglutamate synthase-like GNAT family acetyltransferase
MITIRQAKKSDIPALIALHGSSGVTGILTYLSPEHLGKFYYEPLVSSNKFQTQVALNDLQEVIGVISISDLTCELPRTPKKLFFGVIRRLFLQSFVHRNLWILSINFLRMARLSRNFVLKKDCTFYELQLLLVSREMQSTGIGEILIYSIPTNVKNLVVQTQSVRAVKFYEKFGFSVVQRVGFSNHKLWLLARAELAPKGNSCDPLR